MALVVFIAFAWRLLLESCGVCGCTCTLQGVFLLPSNQVSNSAVTDYALPPEAAGPPTSTRRYDHCDFDALYEAGLSMLAAAGKQKGSSSVVPVLIGGSGTAFTELNRRGPKSDHGEHPARSVLISFVRSFFVYSSMVYNISRFYILYYIDLGLPHIELLLP